MTVIPEILLVDDNPADTDMISDVLGQCKRHSHVCTVADGVEAIAFLHHEGQYAGTLLPDLVVLDLNMPRKNGCGVLAEMKSDPAFKRIPIVVFTSSDASQDIARSYALGANSYVSKPCNLADYIASVKSIEEFWIGIATPLRQEDPWKIITPTSC